MKNTLLLFAALSLALLSWNCGGSDTGNSDSAAKSGNNGAAPSASTENTKPAEPRMQVMVDDLRVRKGPGKDAEVVGELKEGSYVEYLGESSRLLEEVTLRGKKIKAPWMKVRLPDGGEGWVFGGAIEDEKAAAKAKASTGNAADYEKYISSLSKSTCDNVQKANQKLKSDFASASAASQDKAIRAFYGLLKKHLENQQNYMMGAGESEGFDLLGYNPDNKPLPAKVKTKQAEWKLCGIDLDFPEGMAWPVEEHRYMYDNFGTMGTPAMKGYLKQMMNDLKEGFSADAGLVISPQEFADRIVFWQEFRDQFPNFKPLGADLPGFQEYIGFFMTGLDNTPAFDWGEKNDLYPEWKKAYESVMTRVPKSEAGEVIKDYYAVLKKNGFKRSKEVMDFSQKYYEQNEY